MRRRHREAVRGRRSITPNGTRRRRNSRSRCRHRSARDGPDFGADDRAGRTGFETAGFLAMFADVREKNPAEWIFARCVDRLTTSGRRSDFPSGRSCSRKMTCRQVDAPRWPVLSYEFPDQVNPSSGTSFHSLHATSQALQPMQTLGSVKKPTSTRSSDIRVPPLIGALIPSPIIALSTLSVLAVTTNILTAGSAPAAVVPDANSVGHPPAHIS